jgi:hypothetical protein
MKKCFSIRLSLITLSLLTSSLVFSQTAKDSTKKPISHQPVKMAPKPQPTKAPAPVKTPPKKKVTLDGRKYKVLFYEMKATGRGKSVESTVEFNSGRVSSELMNDKLKLEASSYQIVHDSTYKEDDQDMILIKIESHIEGQNEETVWEATVINDDIDGTVTESKNGVEKKKFEFSGSIKGKK